MKRMEGSWEKRSRRNIKMGNDECHDFWGEGRKQFVQFVANSFATIDCMKIGDLVDDGRIVSKLVPEFYIDSFVRG